MEAAIKRPINQKAADQELQRRISLYYHNLSNETVECLAYEQYLQLNLRLQKSLISDFDLESATQSALDDWKIDLAREQEVRQLALESSEAFPLEQKIHFDRLRQFFFDLCVSWCQVLDAELFLFFFNGLFLNISKGYHITASVLKPLEEIEILPPTFFNTVLGYREKISGMRNISKSYEHWYARNFEREEETKRGVEENLAKIFGEKEWRIYDIWLNGSGPAKGKRKSFLKESLNRMTENLNNLDELPRDIEQISRSLFHVQVGKMKRETEEDRSPQVRREKNLPGKAMEKPSVISKAENETAQWKVERIIIDNLPENYKYAKLEEITKNSILLETAIRLPILGRRCKIYKRGSRLTREGSKLGIEIKEKEEEEVMAPPLSTASNVIPIEGVIPPKYYSEHVKETEKRERAVSEKEKSTVLLTKTPLGESNKDTPDGSICEKILTAIQENCSDYNSVGQSSPSPVKKSKAEHQRLVAKVKYQIPDEWQKPFDKNAVMKVSVNKPPVEEMSTKNSQLWGKIGKIARKGPVRALPLSNCALQKTFVEDQKEVKKEKTFTEESKINPKNYVIDDMVERLKDYQHLLTKEDLKKLEELEVDLNSPLDFGLFLADLKNKFNEKYKSPYLHSIGVSLPYKSRRHDMGGAIEQGEWPGFFHKLEKLAERVKRKRRRIINGRKKRGKTLMPRKYIYKPPRRPDVSKALISLTRIEQNELYMSVFMNTASSASTIAEERDVILPEIGKISRPTSNVKSRSFLNA